MAVRAKARSSELYEQDLYAWSRHQADLLHRGRFAELDLEHLVEEIEDAGGSPRFYKASRIEAAAALRAHGERAAADALPTTCPYTLDRIYRRLAAAPGRRGGSKEIFLTRVSQMLRYLGVAYRADSRREHWKP
jgi:hypothetical protein